MHFPLSSDFEIHWAKRKSEMGTSSQIDNNLNQSISRSQLFFRQQEKGNSIPHNLLKNKKTTAKEKYYILVLNLYKENIFSSSKRKFKSAEIRNQNSSSWIQVAKDLI
jgi:hypothetical protein